VNPWDVATWIAAAALSLSGVTIFGFFLRDARSILTRDLHHDESESEGDESQEE
jgi:hypothetical protein